MPSALPFCDTEHESVRSVLPVLFVTYLPPTCHQPWYAVILSMSQSTVCFWCCSLRIYHRLLSAAIFRPCLICCGSLRTSETNYLSEALSFYSAIRMRAYYSKVGKEDRSVWIVCGLHGGLTRTYRYGLYVVDMVV